VINQSSQVLTINIHAMFGLLNTDVSLIQNESIFISTNAIHHDNKLTI